VSFLNRFALPGWHRKMGPSSVLRESLLFLAFLVLTIFMTWPWVTHLRDAASDAGDPYFASWVLWWDYHQTFHNPLNLFHGNIFFPYRYTLAFSEHHYGIALFCFPLFALGFRPLTVHGIATLCGFTFSGYGAFRLSRTLTASTGVAWVTGIAFAFVPYRFGQLPHLVYLSSGWIPILLEALVLFIREPTRRRATWLGIAFFLNALSSIHWFVLTLIPLGLSAIVLLTRNGGWSNAALWRRGVSAFALGSIALIPFFVPYLRVAQLYGFVRGPEEAKLYSAQLIDWLVGDSRNNMWHGLNMQLRASERELFPGLLAPLLASASIFLIRRQTQQSVRSSPAWRATFLLCLDVTLILCAILAVIISGYGSFKLSLFGSNLLTISSPTPLMAFLLVLITRLSVAYPHLITTAKGQSLIPSLRSQRRSDAFWLGVVWTVTGFFGSLGINFFFHRVLYDYVPLFRSIRAPARWAMICYLGLALLAGLGTKQLADLLARHWSSLRPVAVFGAIALAFLVEDCAAPLSLIRGEVDPDQLTLRLKKTPMAGGIVELPSGEGQMSNYLYVLRAADHGRPLVTAVSGFMPPIPAKVQSLTQSGPVPDGLIDLLESIPCSYLVVHNRLLGPANRYDLEATLGRNVTTGRLTYVRSYGEGDDLYAVTKIEPQVRSEAELPFPVWPFASPAAHYLLPSNSEELASPLDDAQFFIRTLYNDFLGREPDPGGLHYWSEQIQHCGESAGCRQEQRTGVAMAFFMGNEFQEVGFFIYRLYKGALGRPPTYAEFATDRARLISGQNLEANKNKFLETWISSNRFTRIYPSSMDAGQFTEALLKNLKDTSGSDLTTERQRLLDMLNAGHGRAKVVRRLIENDVFSRAEYNRAFVTMQYFGYLKRDPDPDEYVFWMDTLNTKGGQAYSTMVHAFINSKEYRGRFTRP
jgi:hypothetical protein